jgi:hypothetical protein
MRRNIVAVLFVFALAGCVVESAAPAYTVVPAPRTEVVPPAPGPAYVWQPGGWHWNGATYVWIAGHYVVRQPAWSRWVPGRWENRNGAWIWVPGHWV